MFGRSPSRTLRASPRIGEFDGLNDHTSPVGETSPHVVVVWVSSHFTTSIASTLRSPSMWRELA
jgi:hypothetical protein